MATATKPRMHPKQTTLMPEEREQVQRFHANSRPNRIASLQVGETDSISARVDFDKGTRADVEARIEELKSTMSKAADTAKKRSGGKFTTEVGSFITRSGDMIITAAVTRIA